MAASGLPRTDVCVQVGKCGQHHFAPHVQPTSVGVSGGDASWKERRHHAFPNLYVQLSQVVHTHRGASGYGALNTARGHPCVGEHVVAPASRQLRTARRGHGLRQLELVSALP